MKKIITIIIVILFVTISLFSQAEQNKQELIGLMDMLKSESFARINWEAVGMDLDGYYFKTNDYFEVAFNRWLQDEPENDGYVRKVKEYHIIKGYKDNFINLFDELNFLGSSKAYFIYGDNEMPVRIAKFLDEDCILITRVAIDNVYNTLRNSARERAASVLSSYVLPTLYIIYNNLHKTDIHYYGIIVTFGSKNFLGSDFSLKAESVCLIVQDDVCGKFVNGEITENELIDASHIFMSDRDMISGFKKVKLEIE